MKKRYGQHFISDRNILQRIVALANIDPEDSVIEIGPGAGSLTRELAAAARRVVAIEIDEDLIPQLRVTLPANVELLQGDALDIDLAALASERTHLVGNLPYNVATPLIAKFIDVRAHLADVTIMLQKEVADRIRAAPGSHVYGPLSVLVQYYATPVRGFSVPAGAFVPRPRVDSSVIRLEWKSGVRDAPKFTHFVHRLFSSRRKQLLNSLAAMFPSRTREELRAILTAAGVDPGTRAETLSVEQFHRVYNSIG